MIYTPNHIKGNAHALWYKHTYITYIYTQEFFPLCKDELTDMSAATKFIGRSETSTTSPIMKAVMKENVL